jgi:hypothetical protein
MPRSRKAPSLPRIMAELLAEADIHGESGEKRLEHGATLKARSKVVEAEGGRQRRRQLRIGREKVEPGESELATFRRDWKIPAHAEEQRYQRADGWYFVVYTWGEVAIALPLEDLPAGL